jgi:hypothetical protein
VRVAMWSGPRNLSTALMRSWGSRPDTAVIDEPLYAHYLAVTGLDHPGRDEILASQETDWRAVVAELTGPIPAGKAIWYQKHMAHHLLPDVGRGWLAELTNVLLIRDPRHVLPSLAKVLDEIRLDDTGYPQQLELLARVRRDGASLVIDAEDILGEPYGMLRTLCAALGIAFDRRMLAWQAGPRCSDGVWARHWYAAVERSTGFGEPRTAFEPLDASHADLLDACMDHYRTLHAERLTA